MKQFNRTVKSLIIAGLTLAATVLVSTARADDTTNAPVKPYPLKTCVVSGDKIGAMGDPIVIVYKGQEVKFCCPDCKPTFLKNPDKYMKKIQDAETAAAKTAPPATTPK
jgi:YHS domain-containing protein